MKTRAALTEGGFQTVRLAKLTGLFYAVNLGVAAVAAAPVAVLVSGDLSHSLEDNRLFLNFDPAWITEMYYKHGALPAMGFLALASVLAVLFLLVNTYLAGGALALFQHEEEAYFSACARYFPRLLRLLLISLVVYSAVFALTGSLGRGIEHFRESSMVSRPWIILHWIQIALAVFLIGVVNMVFDYAKIASVGGETRGALSATTSALRFVSRRPGRTLGVYWVCSAAALALLAAYHGITEATGQETATTVVLVFALRQAYMLARTWVRLWTWSSELHVYTFNSTIVAPEPPSLAVAG